MTDERGRAGRTYTHAELDEHVRSLFGVGGLYELVAYYVEKGERPRCTRPRDARCATLDRALDTT